MKKHFVLIISILILAVAIMWGGAFWLYTTLSTVDIFPLDKEFQSHMESLPREAHLEPYFMQYGTLHRVDGSDTDVLLEEGDVDMPYALREMLCVTDTFAYTACTMKDSTLPYCWKLVAINLDTFESQCLHTFDEPSDIYSLSYGADYSTRNGYYHDGKLVLNDYRMVHEYDMATGRVVSMPYADYHFPQRSIYGTYIDDQTIALHLPEGETQYAIADMKRDSAALASIDTLKMWRYSVQVVNDQIYVLAETKSSHNEDYLVLIALDKSEQKWKHVGNYYEMDEATVSCYFVPQG